MVLFDGRSIDPLELFQRTPPCSMEPIQAVLAHSLSTLNRFTGHAIYPYPVAWHSLFLSVVGMEIAGIESPGTIDKHKPYAEWVLNDLFDLLCLLHDGPECLLGDVNGSYKDNVRLILPPGKLVDFSAYEKEIAWPWLFANMTGWTGYPPYGSTPMTQFVQDLDAIAFFIEARYLLPVKWNILEGGPQEHFSWRVLLREDVNAIVSKNWNFWFEHEPNWRDVRDVYADQLNEALYQFRKDSSKTVFMEGVPL